MSKSISAALRATLGRVATGCRSLAIALTRPRRFFSEHPRGDDGLTALLVVVFVAAASVLGIVSFGAIMNATIDATIVVDNPDRPPELICEQHGQDPDSLRYEACQEPETVERDVGATLQAMTMERLHWGPIGTLILWTVIALPLHVGARLADGQATVADTFEVVAWSLPIELVRMAIGLAVLWVAFTRQSFSDDVDRLVPEMMDAISWADPVLIGGSALVVAWQWHVWRGGLEARHDLSRLAAGLVASVVAIGLFLVAIT